MEVEESTSSTAAVSSKEDNSSLVVGVVPPASASEEKQNEIDDKASNTKEDVDLRDAETRPLFRLSVKLVDTYKYINKVYYEAKAKKLREQGNHRGGVHNDGYDDAHYDYIICGDELFADRYILKHKMGKGSFGQVVSAYDRTLQTDVAIKIIKSKHAFTVQAKTEIRLLNLTMEKDPNDDYNIVRLLDTFVYRKHQCLVFEMLSYNLYELIKNTRFRGVSLALVRKFGKQILRGLEFLARKEVDIIHCDLKPENILLRHPKRSAIKIIDFGSSCLSNKKMYSYIQSRFYRSPEVLLGLPYTHKIDMWSLGCVLVEMHTGEPLFGGVDQLEQLNRIVAIMGMVPPEMVQESPLETRNIFFEKVDDKGPISPENEKWTVTISDPVTGVPQILALKSPKDSMVRNKLKGKTLESIIGVTTGGPEGRRKNDAGHTEENYMLFSSFIRSMLVFNPTERASPSEAIVHGYVSASIDPPSSSSTEKSNISESGNDSNGAANAQSSTKRDNQSEKSEEEEEEEQVKKDLSARQPTADVQPRRARSAPRLLSNSFASSSNSKDKATSEQKGEGDQSSKESSSSHADKPEGENTPSEKADKSNHDSKQCHGEGPMETSELDEEGNYQASS